MNLDRGCKSETKSVVFINVIEDIVLNIAECKKMIEIVDAKKLG